MITMRQLIPPGSPDVDFDAYVPLTAAWPAASGLLDPPRRTALHDGNGYLELKFHPRTHILIEAVLASAPGIQPRQDNLAPASLNDAGLTPYLDPGDSFPAPGDRLAIRAHPDYLYLSFGPDPAQWTGQDPVIFGLAEDRTLTAIAARWTVTERDSVLAR